MKKIIDTLEQESELLHSLHLVMRHLQRQLAARNFEEVNRTIAQIQALERGVAKSEEQRVELCRNIAREKGTSLPSVPINGRELLKFLPLPERPVAKAHLQHMREKILHIQMLSESIRRFSMQASSALRSVFSELFPEERHYTRSGAHLESQQVALLCNERK